MTNGYTKIYEDIETQKRQISEQQKQLTREEQFVGTTRQRLATRQPITKTVSPHQIAKSKQEYQVAKKEHLEMLGEAEITLGEYETKIKEYEEKGYSASVVDDKLKFTKQVYHPSTTVPTARKQSILVYWVEPSTGKTGRFQGFNINLGRYEQNLLSSGRMITKVTTVGGGKKVKTEAGYYTTEDIVLAEAKPIEVLTTDYKKEFWSSVPTEYPALASLLRSATQEQNISLREAVVSGSEEKYKAVAEDIYKAMSPKQKLRYAKEYMTFDDDETWSQIQKEKPFLELKATEEGELYTTVDVMKWKEEQYKDIGWLEGGVRGETARFFAGFADPRYIYESVAGDPLKAEELVSRWEFETQQAYEQEGLVGYGRKIIESSPVANVLLPFAIGGLFVKAFGAIQSAATVAKEGTVAAKVLTFGSTKLPVIIGGTFAGMIGADIGYTAAMEKHERLPPGATGEKLATLGIQLTSIVAGAEWAKASPTRYIDTMERGYVKTKEFALQKYQPFRKLDIKLQQFRHPSIVESSYIAGGRQLVISEIGAAGSTRGLTKQIISHVPPSRLYSRVRSFLQPDWYKYEYSKGVRVFDLEQAIDAARPVGGLSPYEAALVRLSPDTALKTYPRYGEAVRYGDVRPLSAELGGRWVEPDIIPSKYGTPFTVGEIKITARQALPMSYYDMPSKPMTYMKPNIKYFTRIKEPSMFIKDMLQMGREESLWKPASIYRDIPYGRRYIIESSIKMAKQGVDVDPQFWRTSKVWGAKEFITRGYEWRHMSQYKTLRQLIGMEGKVVGAQAYAQESFEIMEGYKTYEDVFPSKQRVYDVTGRLTKVSMTKPFKYTFKPVDVKVDIVPSEKGLILQTKKVDVTSSARGFTPRYDVSYRVNIRDLLEVWKMEEGVYDSPSYWKDIFTKPSQKTDISYISVSDLKSGQLPEQVQMQKLKPKYLTAQLGLQGLKFGDRSIYDYRQDIDIMSISASILGSMQTQEQVQRQQQKQELLFDIPLISTTIQTTQPRKPKHQYEDIYEEFTEQPPPPPPPFIFDLPGGEDYDEYGVLKPSRKHKKGARRRIHPVRLLYDEFM